MFEKQDTEIDELIRGNRIKTKWTEIESYGLSELLSILFEDNPYHDEIASIPIVENGVVCLDLYSGIMEKVDGKLITFVRVYLSVDGNVFFQTRDNEVFLYEPDIIDAEDPRHYFEGE